MATNKNALIRYKVLDKCFSDPYREFTRMTTDDGEPRFITDREIIYY